MMSVIFAGYIFIAQHSIAIFDFFKNAFWPHSLFIFRFISFRQGDITYAFGLIGRSAMIYIICLPFRWVHIFIYWFRLRRVDIYCIFALIPLFRQPASLALHALIRRSILIAFSFSNFSHRPMPLSFSTAECKYTGTDSEFSFRYRRRLTVHVRCRRLDDLWL